MKMLRTATVTSSAVAAMLIAPSPAHAAQYGSAYLSASWGAASASWTWGSYRLSNLYGNTRDTSCDGSGVYSFFSVTYVGGGGGDTYARWDHGCTGDGNDYGPTYIADGTGQNRRIKNVALTLCVDTNGNKATGYPDRCIYGSEKDNPYT